MNHLIVGYGEIGQAVNAILENQPHVTIAVIDPAQNVFNEVIGDVDILHVCFPYSKVFVSDVQEYIAEHDPAHVIIYSTLPIGITKGFPGAVHSPVEGKHPDLEMSIRQAERWIGCNDKKEGLFFANFFADLGIRSRIVENSDFTEALKLLSTTEYGVNLVFADYKARIAEDIGMDFELTKKWNREYNWLYRSLGLDKRIQKFVLDAPNGHIGGHCVTQNAKLLDGQFPDVMVKRVGNMQ